LIICHLLKTGDHIVCGDDVYGGTGRFFRECAEKVYGMEVTFVDTNDTEALSAAIAKENTKLVWLESPTNPLLKVTDIAAVSELTKDKDIILVVDNTFQTPYFQQPLSLGADIVIHSATKYLAGHSDVIMGFAITNNTEIYDKMFYLTYSIGPVPGPFDCYLVQRSLKTLAVRMQAINKNA
jgi:cystathionine gamma-lyase